MRALYQRNMFEPNKIMKKIVNLMEKRMEAVKPSGWELGWSSVSQLEYNSANTTQRLGREKTLNSINLTTAPWEMPTTSKPSWLIAMMKTMLDADENEYNVYLWSDLELRLFVFTFLLYETLNVCSVTIVANWVVRLDVSCHSMKCYSKFPLDVYF